MAKNQFISKLEKLWKQKKFICVGLDPDLEKIPQDFKKSNSVGKAIFAFNKFIIDQTNDLVSCYKPNPAFYEAYGPEGWLALKKTIDYIRQKDSKIPIILDAKRGDIGNTNRGYVSSAFDYLGVDAITVQPYSGKESLQPFLDKKDKGIIVLCKTSNPGAGEFQDLKMGTKEDPLYIVVAKKIIKDWNKNGNCCLVVGATYPKELKDVRKVVGDMPILIPGSGAQGGDLEATVKSGVGKKSFAMIINSSRGIIYAQNPREAALKMNEDILKFF